MKITNKFKLISIVVFIAVVIWAGYYFVFLNKNQAGNTVAVVDKSFGWKYPTVGFPVVGSIPTQIAYSNIRDPGGIPQGLPVRLQIPTIGVDSAIEDALITADGRMDVPSGSKNVAWFALGPHPGQVGSAVIGGHFGISGGVKFVFYDLDKLVVGDKAYVINDQGDTLAFVVRSIKLFDRSADATTVFTSSDGLAHLNLITCEGTWNQVNGSYPERRVVFMDSVSEGATVPAATSFYRSLGPGSTGPDVVTLQNILEQKGFLTMPAGVAKGFFGAVTGAAISKYQTSVGLPSVGLLGPLTIARISSDLKNLALPNAGAGGTVSSSGASIPSATFAEFVNSLYATPLDGLVTSILLILIAFLIFKIIRRRN